MPAHLACSGASDSGVMPGWVLSSRMTRPCVPGLLSSQRKSARLSPLQPKAITNPQAFSHQTMKLLQLVAPIETALAAN